MVKFTVASPLRKKLNSFTDLGALLSYYAGHNTRKFLSEDEFFAPLVRTSDTLYTMANENNMSESDMRLWVWGHLDKNVKCSIITNEGPSGWPIVSVRCCDKTFTFDWADK